MDSFTAIISELGGSTEAARVLGTTQSNTWQMASRNSIPARFWPNIVSALKDKGITMETLAHMAANRERRA